MGDRRYGDPHEDIVETSKVLGGVGINFERNKRLEDKFRNQNKVELASKYIIKWKNMSRRVKLCTCLTVSVLLFMFCASVVSTVLVPFVAINNDSTGDVTDAVNDVHKFTKELQGKLTALERTHAVITQRTTTLSRDMDCIQTYVLYLASERELVTGEKKSVGMQPTRLEHDFGENGNSLTPEQSLRMCLQGGIIQ